MNDFWSAPLLNIRFYRISVRKLSPGEIGNGADVRALNRFFSTWEEFVVPAKRKPSTNSREGFNTTFINFKLSRDEKTEFETWLSRGEEVVMDDIALALSKGLKISISENREKGFYLSSITCRDEGSVNYDFCITSRSNDWYESIGMAVFKVQKLGYDDPWADSSEAEDWG